MSTEDDYIEGEPARVAAAATRRQLANDAEERARRELKIAYARVFSAGDTEQADIDIVMGDLLRFGRMFESTVMPGGQTPLWPTEVLEGRRQVALRIMEHVELPLDVLFQRYHRQG